ncbi:MAG: hypothetical protein GF350_11900 [Chitinivibrionales bacterium]|nr:hypothetical protein [Chitinivibrionales bacterium]
MAWYHQYQYAEIKPGRGYRNLERRALPILRYEIIDQKKRIVQVELFVNKSVSIWIKARHVWLYKSSKDLALLTEQRHENHRLKRLIHHLTPWRKY